VISFASFRSAVKRKDGYSLRLLDQLIGFYTKRDDVIFRKQMLRRNTPKPLFLQKDEHHAARIGAGGGERKSRPKTAMDRAVAAAAATETSLASRKSGFRYEDLAFLDCWDDEMSWDRYCALFTNVIHFEQAMHNPDYLYNAAPNFCKFVYGAEVDDVQDHLRNVRAEMDKRGF
jgi:hypothetical protein